MADELTSDFRGFSIIYHDVRRAIKNPVALALYVILAEYADGYTRQAFPSRAELAKQLGFKKVDTVDRYLGMLQEDGVLTVMPRYKSKDGARSMERSEEFSMRTSSLYIVHDCVKGVPPKNGEGYPLETGKGTPWKRVGTKPTGTKPTGTITPYRPPEGDSRPKAATKTRNAYPDAFEEWWRTYPRRKNASKKAAHTQWAKAVKNIDPGTLLGLTAAYAANPGVSDPKYIPHPHRWLRDERWEAIDEAETPTPQPKPSGVAAWLGYDPNATQPTDGVIDAEIIDTKELPSWTG